VSVPRRRKVNTTKSARPSEVWPMARKRRHEKPKPVKLFTLNLSTFDKLWMRLLDP